MKKRAERERQYKIRIENEEENERRKIEKLKEAAEDKRLMEEYAVSHCMVMFFCMWVHA